jgi:MBG domain (YGX type)/FG-GAP-like repeat
MSRPLVIAALLIAALLAVPNAYASHDGQCVLSRYTGDARVKFVNDLKDVGGGPTGRDLDEWAVLFHEIRTPGCDTDEVIDIYRAKLNNQRGGVLLGGFSGFLSGGVVSFAYSSGVILGGKGKLTQDIDQLLGEMPWNESISADCGFVGFEQGTQIPLWRRGDNCLDDFAVAAAGYAWRAAYFSRTGRTGRANADKAAALGYIDATFKDTSRSICIYDPSLGVEGPGGPCNSSILKLRQSMATGGNIHLIPLNHTMESFNYGIGMVTSIAHAFVGLEAMLGGFNPAAHYANDVDMHTVMTALFQEGQHAATPTGGHENACYRPTENPDRLATRLSEEDFVFPDGRKESCADRDQPKYEPGLYPVAEFYAKNGFATGAKPDDFPFTANFFPTGAFFKDDDGNYTPITFLGMARFEIYKTVAHDWWADRDNRPSFEFNQTFPVCGRPNATITITELGQPVQAGDGRVEAAQKGIVASIPPQPVGATVEWFLFNAEHPLKGNNGGTYITGPADQLRSVQFDAPCVADETKNAEGKPEHEGAIQVAVRVTTPAAGSCLREENYQNFLIAVLQPTALVSGPDAIIRAGEPHFIPVYLTGAGDWQIKWSDGLEQRVTTPQNSPRPYFHSRTVRPTQTTTYKITQVNTVGCEFRDRGLEYGETIVTVIPGEAKPNPVILVENTIASAGVPAVFKARMSTTGGGHVAGALLEFSVFGKPIGSAVTDVNGRAQVTAVVDYPPDSYGSAVKVTFAGNDAINAGSGAGGLTIICASSVTVAPTALNVPGSNPGVGFRDYDIAVTASQYCSWTPQVSDSSWLEPIAPNPNGSGTFKIRVHDLPAGTPSRRGFVFVGSKNIEIFQSSDCTYSFSPSAAWFNADNDFGAVSALDVTAGPGCEWTVNEDESWISLVQQDPQTREWVNAPEISGTGNGRVNFRVNSNSGNPRTGRLHIEDGNGARKASAIINQYAPPPCTPPDHIITSDGYSVSNGQNISYYAHFTGTNLRYTIFIDGLPEVLTTQSVVILPRWHGWYPETGRSVRIRIVAQNDCGGASSEEASFHNAGGGESCLVPDIRPHPGIHSSPRPGANVTLEIAATGPQGQFDDGSFKYQWYHGFPGDDSSKVFNGAKKAITVSPGQTSFYWASVDDPNDNCGPQISGPGVVVINEAPPRRRRAVRHDFTGDGKSDLVLHNKNSHANEIWAMNGGTKQSAISIPQSAPNERLQSIGDLNDDEQPDLIVRNPETGANSVWTMNHTFRTSVQPLPSRAGSNWTIGAVADFDDDQHHDIVWHNDATGETEIWFQEGTERAGTFTLPPTPDGNWGLHGSQDFTRDEKPDLFFYNRVTGQSSIWVMDDGKPVTATGTLHSGTEAARIDGDEPPAAPRRRFRMTAKSLATVQDTNYEPASVADFNGDGMPDIVWRHKTTGENQLWVMSNTTHVATTEVTPQPDTNWQIGGGGSTTGDGGTGGGGEPGGTTSMSVSAQAAMFNGASVVTATLTSNGTVLSGRTIVFVLNGAEVSRLRTDANGAAIAAISVAGIAAGTHANAITVRFDGDAQYAASSASADLVIERQQPVVTWNTPAPITYGTALGAAQLNATANVAGTFVYNPPAGTILDAGHQALDVTFTPTDGSLSPVSKSVILLIHKATATVTWPQPSSLIYGTPLSEVQLNATTTVPGSFTYNPPSGTILAPGTHTLQATFAGNDNYDVPAAFNSVTVVQGAQTIHWNTPSAITYGQALNSGQLNATVGVLGAAPAGTLSYSPAAGTVLPAGTHTLTAIAAPTQYYTGASKSVQLIVNPAAPAISWANPASIVYGTALSSTQLNATASVPGTFAYSPAAGTVLNAGTHTLSVQFTPNDTANYAPASRSVTIVVTKATPSVTWPAPAPIVYGTALSSTQLNASANVAGSFTYSPVAGTVLDAGTHTLSVQFTPNDSANYNNASATTTLNVTRAPQTISWSNPAAIVYGTVLSQTQLNAAVSVVGPAPAGALSYNPPAGTLLQAGNGQVLTVTAAATSNYEQATKSVTIDVLKAKPVITWSTPAPIVYRTPLSGAQLNATANVPGSFVYTPAAGTVLEAGLQTLSTHFAPNDTHNYETADASVTLEIQQATPIITWSSPAGIVYGTALSSTQLNATADVPGSFVYTPAAGTILDAGNGQTLSVQFTPEDTRNFKNASATTTIDVAKAKQTLSWNAPAPIVYGTPLSSTQLNATVSVVGPAAPGALVYSPVAGTVLDAGNHTLSVTAQETSNYESATLSVALEVTRKPLSLVVDPKSKLYGGAVPVLTGTLTGVVNNDNITPSYATPGTIASPAGTYPITGSLNDPNSRLFNYSVTITPSTLTVLPAPLQISADPKSKQYSDPLPQLTATFTGLVLGETPAVLSGALVLETTATRLSAPGTYPIAIGGLASPNYAIVYVNSTLTVTQEDARVTITSPLLVSSTTTKPASITLTATVKDISATADANGDAGAGDIRKATLAFVDRATNAVLCTAPIGLVSASDERVGAATCTFTRDFGASLPASLTVGAQIDGYYARNATADDVTLSIVTPTADFISGGGALTVSTSAGSYAPDLDSNFTVNANLQFDKNGVLKGNFTFTFKSNGKSYELTTAASSMAIVRTTTGGKTAITGTGTLRDMTMTTAPVVITAAPIVITATDAGEPSTNDKVSVALMKADGGFWLAAGWNGTAAAEQNLRDGNLIVHYKK